MRPSTIVACYLLVQAIGILAWWGLLIASPGSIQWFQPAVWPPGSLLAFWLADGLLLVGGSLVAATGVFQEKPWASVAVWAIALVSWYPTLVCLATSLQTGEAWIATALMVSMAGLSLAMATIYGNSNQAPATIRATLLDRSAAVIWTVGQIVIFWGTFLIVLPLAIIELQGYVGWGRFQHMLQTPLAIGLLVLASALGLWSGFAIATRGGGTPLPTATAPRLVVAGPYRFVRNPMAVAGIVQGLAVGWLLGSIPVMGYALLGGVLWHAVVRPVEERDLAERFGEAYRTYQRQVGLWLPKIKR